MATQSGFDIANDFILQAREYANVSIDKALTSISDILASSNDANYFDLQPNPNAQLIWGDEIQKPYTKADIPSIDNNNFQYIKLYQDDWLEKYNLIMSENFDDLLSFKYSESKLQEILQNGYIIDKNVQNQIINRAVDTEMSLFNTKKDNILLDWSSKGWNIPSSFTISRVDTLKKEIDDKISNINRDYVIKNQDLHTDMLKFAIQVSTELLPKCVDIASSFASKYSQVYNYGAENVKNYLNGLSVVNQSFKDYHNVIIQRVQTSVQEGQSWRNYDLDAKNKQAQFELQKVNFKLDSTVKGVELLTRIGTAALSANQSIVSLTNQTLSTITGTNVT